MSTLEDVRVLVGLLLLALVFPAAGAGRSKDYLWQCVAITREDARYSCYARLLLERVERSGDPRASCRGSTERRGRWAVRWPARATL